LINTKTLLGMLATVATVWLSGATLLAQEREFGGPPGGGPGGNFDPAQFRQRMMEQVRKNLSVTNDEEWGAIQPLIQKVMDARREAFMGGGMGMGMGPGGPPPGGGQGGPPPDGGRGGFGPQPSAEQQALQKVISGNAAVPQIKDALAKFRAARKDKQAKLEAAQADLRNVLTLKQEAQAVLMGLLQ
jgi:hypothetical protein